MRAHGGRDRHDVDAARWHSADTPHGYPETAATPSGLATAKESAPAPAKRVVKLSFKDQHRLGVLESLTPKLSAEIAAQEKQLEDPALYARDPAGFDKIMKSLAGLRAQLAAAEDEWLMLEEKREALASSDS